MKPQRDIRFLLDLLYNEVDVKYDRENIEKNSIFLFFREIRFRGKWKKKTGSINMCEPGRICYICLHKEKIIECMNELNIVIQCFNPKWCCLYFQQQNSAEIECPKNVLYAMHVNYGKWAGPGKCISKTPLSTCSASGYLNFWFRRKVIWSKISKFLEHSLTGEPILQFMPLDYMMRVHETN